MTIRDSVILGSWRIVGSDLWERGDLDLLGPATLTIGDRGRGEITVGALTAALALEYARTTVFFHWQGADDMTEVAGEGAAELQDDGLLEIELRYENGDEMTLTAVRQTGSSTTC